MTDKPVFFLDSGIGGLPYVETARRMLPRESFYYLADRRNFPYGEKSPDQVISITRRIVAGIAQRFDPKALVIACNTASVVALESLRELVSIPVVGVVPAIKPAAEQSANKSIGVLATRRTISDRYTEDLIARFASGCRVFRHGAGDIVDLVENHPEHLSERRALDIIGNAVDRFRGAGIDSLVLGCTHFLYIEEVLRSLLGDEIRLVDSRWGVSRQLKRVLNGGEAPLTGAAMTGAEQRLPEQRLPEQRGRGDHRFMFTGHGGFSPHYRGLAQRFGLAFEGSVAL